ncbi:MAG: EFR1 family ferrodoxin [Oscillospiraceae bacterium]|nr:EFR1 family ferrodoxin [Oscillospiraceae bacterium]
MILYFTGTGNSKFVADYLADKLEDTTVSINKYLKNGEDLICNSEKPYVIVAPIYAWRFPAVVENLLKKSQLNGCKSVYCIATMGENSGNADKYLRKIFADKGMNFTGYTGVVMQNNYLFMEKMPKARDAFKALNSVVPYLDKIAEAITNDKPLKKQDKTPLAAVMSSVVNAGFNKFMVKKQSFNVDTDCISCGKCVSGCPVNNIVMKDRKPVFSTNCAGCLACLHHCPKQAINVRNDTQDKGRYVCAEYKHWKTKNS